MPNLDEICGDVIGELAGAMNSWDSLEFGRAVYGDTKERLASDITRHEYIMDKQRLFRTDFGMFWGSLDGCNRANLVNAITKRIESAGMDAPEMEDSYDKPEN